MVWRGDVRQSGEIRGGWCTRVKCCGKESSVAGILGEKSSFIKWTLRKAGTGEKLLEGLDCAGKSLLDHNVYLNQDML